MKRKEALKLCLEFLKIPSTVDIGDIDIIRGLGLDSLDKVEFIMWFEEEFEVDVPDNTEKKYRTLNNFLDLVVEK